MQMSGTNLLCEIDKNPFSFVVTGDMHYRGGTSLAEDSWPVDYSWVFPKMLDDIATLAPKPKHLTVVGDLVDGYNLHPWECTPQRYDSQYKNFLKDLAKLDPQITFVPVVGNHDYHRLSLENDPNKIIHVGPQKFAEYMFPRVPTNAKPEKSPYYSFNCGNTHFTIICTGLLIEEIEDGVKKADDYNDLVYDKQYKWLSTDLKKAAADPDIEHVLVFGHRNFYPMKGKEGYERLLAIQQRIWKDLFVKYGVDAYIHGHYHLHEHTLHEHVPMLCFGGGSAVDKVPDVDKDGFNHYAVFEVNGPDIKVNVFRLFKEKESVLHESFMLPDRS
jgi:hypothetical protein